MRPFLCLDIASVTGWCMCAPDRDNIEHVFLEYGSFSVPKTNFTGEKFYAFGGLVQGLITNYKPEFMFVEKGFFNPKQGHGALFLAGLRAIAEATAFAQGVGFGEVENTVLKNHALGKGFRTRIKQEFPEVPANKLRKKVKEKMIAFASTLVSGKIEDDNQADAIVMAHYIQQHGIYSEHLNQKGRTLH